MKSRAVGAATPAGPLSRRAPGEAGPPGLDGSVRTRDEGDTAGARDFTAAVVGRLRRLRVRRGLRSSDARAALGGEPGHAGRVELGQSTPTIAILWKIARALGVTFSGRSPRAPQAHHWCIRRAPSACGFTSQMAPFVSRALFPTREPAAGEFYELRLASGARSAGPHPPGTIENLVVAAASSSPRRGEDHRLETGDALLFEADGRTATTTRGSRGDSCTS